MQLIYFLLFSLSEISQEEHIIKRGIKREKPDSPGERYEYEPVPKCPSAQTREDRVLAPKANSEPILSSHRSNLDINTTDYNMLLLRQGIESFNRNRNASSKTGSSPIEVLIKIFPTLRRYILELILKGCDNDIVQAIECILATNNQSPSQLQTEVGIPRGQEVPIHYQVTRQQGFPIADTMTTSTTFPNMDFLARSRGLARAQIYGPASRFSSVVTKCTPPLIPTMQFDRMRQNCSSPEARQCLKCGCGTGNGEAVCCSSTETVRHYQPNWI